MLRIEGSRSRWHIPAELRAPGGGIRCAVPSRNIALTSEADFGWRSPGRMVTNLKLTKVEFQIMEPFWNLGELSIREVQDAIKARRAYTTIQTIVYRLEVKLALRRVGKIGNFHIFAPVISRKKAERRLVDDLLAQMGGRSEPILKHLIASGKLTLDDVKNA